MAKYIEVPAIVDGDGATVAGVIGADGIMTVPGVERIKAVDMLAMLKKQVRADDFTEDDEYLEQLLDAATAHIISETNRTEKELRAMNEGEMPHQLNQAVLMLAAHWYNQRETVAAGQMAEVPYTLSALVKPFVKLSEQ